MFAINILLFESSFQNSLLKSAFCYVFITVTSKHLELHSGLFNEGKRWQNNDREEGFNVRFKSET